eukprot:gene10102-12391_t
MCPTAEKETWVSIDGTGKTQCPPPQEVKQEAQVFLIPEHILGESIPYEPVFYVTNKISGEMTFMHKVDGKSIYSIITQPLINLDVEEYAYKGGQMKVFREGPLENVEGEFITTTCNNETTGCIYEPETYLNAYTSNNNKIHMINLPTGGSTFHVSLKLQAGSSSSLGTPEVFIQYKLAGRSPEQDKGLILLIIGGVFADLMPATLFFLLQKFYYQKKSVDDLHGMIPLMEMN